MKEKSTTIKSRFGMALPWIALLAAVVVVGIAIRSRGGGMHLASNNNALVVTSTTGPWPECIGWTGEECCHAITQSVADVQGRCYVIPAGSMVTMDYVTNRVRVFVDENNIVTKAPVRG